jgi:NAD+ diphosphatase
VKRGYQVYYIFQDSFLLTPEETPDSLVHEAVNIDETVFSGIKKDIFTIPSLHGYAINAIMLNTKDPVPGWKQIPVRQAAGNIAVGKMLDGVGESGNILRAFHIAQWRRNSRYCGCCGNINRDDEKELARLCTSCGHMEFPRISPAVITIVVNDRDEALLASNKRFISGMYSLIAGFNEAGESLEATVAREIREEVAIDVSDIRYVKSQPWPFPNSLMIGFTARYAGGEIKTDDIEIGDAKWFSRDALPSIPGFGSVSRYLIELWLNRQL